ncbi:MAG: A/G-specific adenine glycosylase [Cytophagales bacterium]|nr:A/G-specific adenine glycosylase [Cytophagales bacterium]
MTIKKLFSEKIIHWYHRHKRSLPWRYTNDPYYIWVSEILLQQTRVNQGVPYYYRFIEKFPNIYALASAPLQEVLRVWQGLGYYSRARNMHATAIDIVQNHKGVFPKSYHELLKLKGVGKYSAAAIASFAYKEKVPALDGNAIRVLCRVHNVYDDVKKTKTQNTLFSIGSRYIADVDASDFNQAIIEFGAIQCKAHKPLCGECILSTLCEAYRDNNVENVPYASSKIKAKARDIKYAVLTYNETIMMKKRTEKDIWIGLYDFVEIDQLAKLTELDNIMMYINTHKPLIYKHILTHQKLTVYFWQIEVKNAEKKILKENGFSFYHLEDIVNLPKSVIIDRYINHIFKPQ